MVSHDALGLSALPRVFKDVDFVLSALQRTLFDIIIAEKNLSSMFGLS